VSVRYRPGRRCRNCPETLEGLPVEAPQRVTSYQGEGESLWQAAFVNCGTLFELLFRYISMDVPGKPLPQLERLQKRLAELITLRKERENRDACSSAED
jgi:hypothetical protein